ncbi:glycosyl hydrolase family 65 protein [Xenorhabdus szentirmaii]|uniref:glycosyl hydrolase family 65 protein n=1 Tax=Xenorhabdus szentirmaii TaxID=290112 RepID=UPI002B409157|nr:MULTISPECIES: glycosyl hydrolase family 65 protein [unclassified Xenorhabdus]
MLSISYGKQHERVTEISTDSSAFISCVATLANRFIGVRPHVPASSERTQRVQLLMDGVYTSGVGVSREIVSLPAPRILRLYDVETGESVRHQDGKTAKITLSLDEASVISTEYLHVRGEEFELKVKQFIDVPNQAKVSTIVELRQINPKTPRRLRLDYGLDTSAVNEYLGTSPWLTSRHYNIGQCHFSEGGLGEKGLGEKGVSKDGVSEDGVSEKNCSVIVATAERQLYYDVQCKQSPLSSGFTTIWADSGRSCTTSVTFDFSMSESHQLVTHWQVRSEEERLGLEISPSPFDIITCQSEHQTRWNRLWAAHDVTVNAPDEPIELGIKYAVFHLLQHGIGAHDPMPGFISPARGLTSPYHSGATFFDTELHKCIFWIWNDPRVARSLIDYRYHCMDAAIEYAKSAGFSGARFPEASNDRGAENGPHYVLSYPDAGVAREWSVDEVLHISADVCYALYRYWSATRDDAYMDMRGYKIIAECARFAASVFTWSDEKQAYVINSVMGPDEYHYHVDNSFFTNYLLRWCIQFALSLVDCQFFPGISVTEAKNWQTITDNVYLPWMVIDGIAIPEEFEGYQALEETGLRNEKKRGPQFMDDNERSSAAQLENFTTRAIKQADIVLLMSMFPEDFSDEVKQAAFKFYEPRTVHESSLSYGPHAVLAADIGEANQSADFISRASRYNLDFTPISDYSNGLHLSAYAGAWQGLVEGLAGLRVDGGKLYFRPRLPSHWHSFRFTLYFRKKRLRITVLADDTVDIYCCDEKNCGEEKLATEYCPDGRISLCDESIYRESIYGESPYGENV